MVKTCEEMWRVEQTLHANNTLLISEIWYVCEEWRLILRICEKKIWLNTPTLHNLVISSTNIIDYMYEEASQHFITLHANQSQFLSGLNKLGNEMIWRDMKCWNNASCIYLSIYQYIKCVIWSVGVFAQKNFFSNWRIFSPSRGKNKNLTRENNMSKYYTVLLRANHPFTRTKQVIY